MRGVLLAGGTGSRLRPLTEVINKHLLAVGNKPMIYYPLQQFRECGIEKVMVITGREHAGSVFQQLGSGRAWGMEFSFRVQEDHGGIAEALSLAEDFVGDDHVMVQLADNLFGESLQPYQDQYDIGVLVDEAMVLLKETDTPERFGIAAIGSGGFVEDIEEKPKAPQSNFAVTGCYFYPPDVFEIIRTIERSPRGELEITDVNKTYIERGLMRHRILSAWWSDAGTPESLERAQRLVWEETK